MRRLRKFSFTVFTFLFATIGVQAASMCDVSEVADLNREVVNIKGNFEEKEGTLDPTEFPPPDSVLSDGTEDEYVGTYNYFQISIVNLSERFYVEVSNDYNREVKTFYYSDAKDGVVTFDWENINAVTKFTIKIYSSDKTGCGGELYRTTTVTTPRRNEYYDYGICSVAEGYYLCDKYVTYPEVEFSTFIDRVTRYVDSKENENNPNGDNDSWIEKTGNFIGEHKVIFIVCGVALIIAMGVVVAVIVKKHRSSDEV